MSEVSKLEPARYLTVEQVAAYLSMSPKAIRRRVDSGSIPYRKVGRLLRFDRLAIDAWISGTGLSPRQVEHRAS